MVYMELVKARLPAVAEHLEKASLVPEAYAQVTNRVKLSTINRETVY